MAQLLSYTYLVSTLAFATVVSALALTRHLSVPYVDDWRLLDQMYRSPLLAWLFSSQNGHRIPATLLLLYLDQTLAGGRMHLPVIAMLAAAWTSAAILAVGLRRSGVEDPALRRSLLAFGVFALFWSGGAFNFYWGTNHGSVWTTMWLLVALFAFAAERDRIGAPGGARPVLLALASAVLATFGHGMGVASWAALLALWAVARMPWRTGLALVAAALVSVGVHSIGQFDGERGEGSPTPVDLLTTDPRDLLPFVCAFVGAPVAWTLRGLGLVGEQVMLGSSTAAGAIAVLGTCLLAALAWRRGRASPGASLVGFGLMVFALAGGALVGVTRLAIFGASQALELRFLCWSALFWIGAAWGLGAIAPSPRTRLGWAGALAALSFAMLPGLLDSNAALVARSERVANVTLLLLLGVRPDAMLDTPAPPPPDLIERVTKRLAHARRSPFDDARYGLAGSPFAERFSPSRGPACGRDPKVWWRSTDGRLAGVVGVLERSAATPSYVVLVDSQGVVRGLGEERPALRATAASRAWAGMIAGVVPDERYAAWAVLRDGRSACPLGVVASPTARPAPRARGRRRRPRGPGGVRGLLDVGADHPTRSAVARSSTASPISVGGGAPLREAALRLARVSGVF